jgi:hypothetical protein
MLLLPGLNIAGRRFGKSTAIAIKANEDDLVITINKTMADIISKQSPHLSVVSVDKLKTTVKGKSVNNVYIDEPFMIPFKDLEIILQTILPCIKGNIYMVGSLDKMYSRSAVKKVLEKSDREFKIDPSTPLKEVMEIHNVLSSPFSFLRDVSEINVINSPNTGIEIDTKNGSLDYSAETASKFIEDVSAASGRVDYSINRGYYLQK